MANKFVASWEYARQALFNADPLSDQPYNPALVAVAMLPALGSRRSDRTFVTTYEIAIAFDSLMTFVPLMGLGVVSAGALARCALPTVGPALGGDGLPPLYLSRTDIVAANQGVAIIAAIGLAIDSLLSTIIAPPFLGVAPPTAALNLMVLTAWQSSVYSGQVNLLDAAVVRYITASFSGGEGDLSDEPL